MSFRIIAFCMLIIITGSCARHLYQGVELPPEQTSRIYFSAEQYSQHNGVSLSNMEIDNQSLELLDAGAYVLPGKHTVSFDFRYNYEDCRYLFREDCLFSSSSGSCSLDFESDPGKEYKVSVWGHESGASAMVIETETYRAVSNKGCPSPSIWD